MHLRTGAAFDLYLEPFGTVRRRPPGPWHARIDLPSAASDHPGAAFTDTELRDLARRIATVTGLDDPSRPQEGCDWIAVRELHTLHLASPAVTRSGRLLVRADLTARALIAVDAARAEIHRQDDPTERLPGDGTIVMRRRDSGAVTAEGCDATAERALARIGMRPVALPFDTPWMRTPYGTVPAALPGYANSARRTLTALGYRVSYRTDAPQTRAHPPGRTAPPVRGIPPAAAPGR